MLQLDDVILCNFSSQTGQLKKQPKMMMMCGLNVLPFLLVLTTIHLSDELLVFPSNNTTPVSKRINYSLDPFISDFLQTDFRTGRRKLLVLIKKNKPN